jgi:hypothetical protein
MTITSISRIYTIFFLLYSLDITFHNYSNRSALGGFLAFLLIFCVGILDFKSKFRLLSTYLVPVVFLLLALFVARSTMTVAFFYFSCNISIARNTNISLMSLFRPTLIFIYLFAGLNKFSPGFRSGSILQFYLPDFLKDYSQYLSISAIIFELLIALLIYLRWAKVVYLILMLHFMIQILIPTDWLHFFALLIYGAAMSFSAFVIFSKSSERR